MNIHFPPSLVAGDLIAITAPSSGVPAYLHPRLDLAINHLRRRGYRVLEGKCLRAQYKNKSADKHARAEELMSFLCNPEIKAVMPPWGGDLGMELLELLDFERLAVQAPKWFIGFSDLSTFHFPLSLRSGWATVHGPNLMELGAGNLDLTTRALWDIVESPRGNQVTQHASSAYQVEENQWGVATDAGFNLTQPTQWKMLNNETECVAFSGRLIGGCLDIISRLAGTEWGNLPPFIHQCGNDGVILYFENVEMGPCELTRALYSLRLHGWLTSLNGILIGRNAGPDADNSTQQNYLDALHSALGGLNIPVIYDVDIGHIPPQMSLVNGALATVTYRHHRGSITQQL